MFRAILLFVAILPLVAAMRLLFQRGIRLRLRGFPRMRSLVLGALVLAIISAISAAVYAPVLIALAACLSAGVIALDIAWRNSSYGVKQGLPPGSLAFLSPDPWSRPDYYEKAAKTHGNIFKFRHFTRPAVGITGIERISEFLRTHEHDLTVPPAPFNEIVPSGFIRYLDGADHDRIASALRSAFNPTIVAHYCSQITTECTVALERLRSGEPLDSVVDKMTCRITLLLFFGIGPQESSRFETLFGEADYRFLGRTGRSKAMAAVETIVTEMRVIAAHEDRVSFLSQLMTHHPDAIHDDAMLANLAYSLHTGRLDINGLVVWLAAVAGANPHWMQKLRHAIVADGAAVLRVGGLADRIVRETLRLHQSEFLMRRTRKLIEFQGYRIPAGWHVRLCIAESHRSEDAFKNPTTFNPDRFLVPLPRSVYSPFGFAPRACPGEHLARAIGRHFIAALAQRYSLSVTGVEPWEFTGFHWKPNSTMNLDLSAVS